MKLKNNQKGMTLLETLVAVLVLSIFSIVTFTTFNYSLSANDTADKIAHVEKIKNEVLEQFQANPARSDLLPIMPQGSTKLNEDAYSVLYNGGYKDTNNENEAIIKMDFLRSYDSENRDGFLIDSKETIMEVLVYTKENVGGLPTWTLFASTITDGTSKISAFQFTDDSGGAGLTTKTIEIIGQGAQLTFESQQGSTILLSNVSHDTTVETILSSITITPEDGAILSSRKIEIYNPDIGEWEEMISPEFPRVDYVQLRIRYDVDQLLGLELLIPSYLSASNLETISSIDTVPFLANALEYSELSIESFLSIYEKANYSSIFKGNVDGVNIDYKDIIWTNTSDTRDVITYSDLESGVSLLSPDGSINVERFKGNTYIASVNSDVLDRNTLAVKVTGLDVSLVAGESDIITFVDYFAPSQKITNTELAKLIYKDGKNITSMYVVEDNVLMNAATYTDNFVNEADNITSSFENSGYIIKDDTSIQFDYSKNAVSLNVVTSKNGVNTSDEFSIVIAEGQKLTSTIINAAIVNQLGVSADVMTLYSDYTFNGAYINEKNYFNSEISKDLDEKTLILKYEKPDKAMDVQFVIDARELPDNFTSASQSEVYLEDVHGKIQARISGNVQQIQSNPTAKTESYIYETYDIKYSVEGSVLDEIASTSELKETLANVYNRGNYDGVNISVSIKYNYVDIYDAYINGGHKFNIGNASLNSSTMSTSFSTRTSALFYTNSQQNSFGLKDITGLETIYNTNITSMKETVSVPNKNGETKNVTEATVILDVSNIVTENDVTNVGALHSLETGRQDLQVGIVERGDSGVFDFVYYEEGNPNNLMIDDSDRTKLELGGITHLDKLTIIVYRAEDTTHASSLNNYYGVWTPGIKATTKSRVADNSSSIIEANDLFKTKNVYSGIQEAPGSIQIGSVEVVMATGMSGSYGNDIEGQINPLTPNGDNSAGILIPGTSGSNLIYGRNELPAMDVPFTDPSGTSSIYTNIANLFGDTGDLLTSWTKAEAVSGGGNITYPSLVGGIEFNK